jgi:hypothetical protein
MTMSPSQYFTGGATAANTSKRDKQEQAGM